MKGAGNSSYEISKLRANDWCGFCVSLDKEVFATADFKAWAKQNAVPVTVDLPNSKKQDEKLKAQNADLKKKFMPSGGFPTVVLIDPDGKIVCSSIVNHSDSFPSVITHSRCLVCGKRSNGCTFSSL